MYNDNSINVIDAGIGNCGYGSWIKFLESEGVLFNPRLIVMQLGNSDFEDNLDEKLYYLSVKNELLEYSSSVQYQRKLRIAQKIIESIPGLFYSYFLGLIK